MLRKKIRKVPVHVWILIGVTMLGIFLRTYNLREWLYFYPDQARDAWIVEEVVNEGKPWPLMGAIAASTKFKIGPMYYYFQIITAKIFGTGPQKMVYPDLFFTILSIPLMYYFLSLIFSRNLSLALAGLYSVSFYAIEYSRFAWNPNSIPFFVLAFLIAVWKFMLDPKRSSWLWVFIIGMCFGIGVQLHTLMLLLMPVFLFMIFIFLIYKKIPSFKKWAVILFLCLALNIPQMISERENNYANSRVFLKIFKKTSDNGKSNFIDNLKLNVIAHSQATAHILSGLGNKLDIDYPNVAKNELRKLNKFRPLSILKVSGVFLSLGLFIFGCWRFWRHFKDEKNKEKKYLLALVTIFSALSFIIMLPMIDSLALRYFNHLIFLPFIFLGFFFIWLKNYFPKRAIFISAMIFCSFALTNFITIGEEAKAHVQKRRSDEKYIVLGEIEMIRDYMISEADKAKKDHIYLFAEKRYQQNYFKPITYVMRDKGYNILRTKKPENISFGEVVFLLGVNSLDSKAYLNKYEIEEFMDFGQIGVYKLKK